MAKPINIPNVFAAATSAIPLSQLDQDFSTLANATNDLATYSNYVADTGAANAFIANYPVNTNTGSLTTGLRLQFKAANANSGASTLNVQVNGASIGTASIRLTDGSALPANTIVSGAMVDVMYDGTNFQLMNDPSGGQEVITNLTLSGNLTVTGTSNFTGNVTANVANTTTSTITNLSSGNVTITGGTISNVTLDNVTVDVETFSNITINGTATFAAGTVSAPSITTSGDTNTGIYFPAADTIAFTEGGVEAMRIDSSGNVGIGTSSPTALLDVNGNLAITGSARRITGDFSNAIVANRVMFQTSIANSATSINAIPNGTSTASNLRAVNNSDPTNSAFVGVAMASTEAQIVSGIYGTGTYAPMVLYTGGSERLRIDTSGNVIQSAGNYFLANNSAYVWGDATTYIGGNSSSDFINFITNTSERMRIDSSGNVGIGTSSPSVPFHVNGVIGSTNIGTANTGINGAFVYYSSSSTSANFASGNSGSGSTFTPIVFGQTNTATFSERMRIDSSGNVGIGTSSPAHRLSVVEDTNGFSRISFTNANAGTSAAAFMYAITSGNRYLGMIVSGANRTGTTVGLSNASLVTLEAGTDSSAFLLNQAANNPMVFATNGNERMRITSGGALCVGTTDTFGGATFRLNGGGTTAAWIQQTNSTTNNGLFVYLQGNRGSDTTNSSIYAGDDTNTRFRVLGNGNVQNTNNSYGSISDIKLKENIVDATPKLDKISQVRVVNYNLKGETQNQIGVIAQELETIFPSMIEEHKDTDREGNDLGTTTKSVKYSVFVPILIKAIQELNAKVEAQAAEIALLKSK